ncbi:hypothetical protein [Actinophytocola sp.]|uniref:RICIN domain-containing protein n=1 Tax=Actinophytocola sp. TaxID=1872138 RepID=UPI002ED9A612
MVDDWPDPRAAKDVAGFVAAMRALRARTGLSFRALERNAERAGDVLPTSTINAALSRDKLPRADLVAAFVRACGGGEHTVDAWLAARADLAVGADAAGEGEPAADDPITESAPQRWGRAGVLVAAGSVIVLAAALVTVLVLTTDQPQPSAARRPTGTPQDVAAVPIVLAHSGLCVGEGPERPGADGRVVLGQQDCATAGPPISLESAAGGTFRLILHHPVHGRGCVTVDGGGIGPGLLLAGADCEDDRPDQTFAFERVTAPVAGHRLHSLAAADLCVGTFRDSGDPGVQLIQAPCDGRAHQVFTIDSELLPVA